MATREELLLELEKRPVPKELLEIKEKTIQKYNEFFNMISQRKFQIYIIYTREEMDIIKGKKTEYWMKGYSSGPERTIFIFDSEHYEKETGKKITNIETLLKHEIAHQFYGEIVHSHSPNWLNEGLAEYLANRQKSDKSLEEIVNCINFWDSFAVEQYTNSHKLVDLIITKYGKEKLLTLLRSFKNKEEFYIAFKEIYGFELTKENLIENLKE